VQVEALHWRWIPARTKTGKISERKKRRRAEKAGSWLDGDFWEEHVMGREKDYVLPAQNRRSVRVARGKMEGKEGVGVRVGVDASK